MQGVSSMIRGAGCVSLAVESRGSSCRAVLCTHTKTKQTQTKTHTCAAANGARSDMGGRCRPSCGPWRRGRLLAGATAARAARSSSTAGGRCWDLNCDTIVAAGCRLLHGAAGAHPACAGHFHVWWCGEAGGQTVPSHRVAVCKGFGAQAPCSLIHRAMYTAQPWLFPVKICDSAMSTKRFAQGGPSDVAVSTTHEHTQTTLVELHKHARRLLVRHP